MMLWLWSLLWPYIITGGLTFLTFLVLLPTKFGEKLLGYRFDKKLAIFKSQKDLELAVYKTQNDREIERLKSRLSHLSDRGKHSNEREFASIVRVWDTFVEAHVATNACLSRLQMFPDLDQMDDEALKLFLSASDLEEPDKIKVEKSREKKNIYGRILRLNTINRASKQIFDARLALRKEGVFVTKAIYDLVEEKIDALHEAWIEETIDFEWSDGSLKALNARTALRKHGEDWLKEVQLAIRQRLLKDDSPT